MWLIISSNYATYVDDVTGKQERHALRLFISVAVALALSSFASSFTGAHTMMATGFTIFAGFVYSALFSPHAMGGADLPRPTSETDRVDLERLRKLVKNFRIRSIYFIAIAIIEILALTAIAFSYTVPDNVTKAYSHIRNNIDWPTLNWAEQVLKWLEVVMSFLIPALIIFLFLEGLHAFFRLSTAMVEIVKTRQEYLENRHG